MVMPAHYSVICFTKGKPNSLPIYNSNHSTLETHSLTTQKEFYCIRNSCLKNRQRENINDKMSITNIWWDIHRLKHNSQRVDHPTQLPPLFMKRLISIFTNEGDIVLDPFNGSGTTSLCSKQLNRKYLGIELSQKYYDISIQRHIELNEGVDPFGKREKTPKAKNSSVKRLKKQKYEVDKKTLQLEVKEISKKLNKVPSREDIIANSQYPIKYFDEYFINWGEVVAAARTTGMQNVENKKDYDALVGNGHK
jgi:site-specific DNA-methyltransferase (adenine-specific)